MSVIIVGAGIGGLTLALELHARGIHCRIYEAVRELEPLGVGLNLLPHAMREMAALNLADAIRDAGVETRSYRFYNRFGQLIHAEPRGVAAGYTWPQVSVHRGALQSLLLDAVKERLGPDAVRTGHRCVFIEQTERGVVAHFDCDDGAPETVIGEVLIGCDGIRSAVRGQVWPMDDPLVYAGITMWRGVTRRAPFLDGATMVYAGWLETGKVIAYPIAEPDADGLQLVNWLCEFFCPPREPSADWSRPGRPEDFAWACADMHFDFLDVPALVAQAEFVYEYPMVDRDPLPYWTDGRVTLLGDAAHPMTPRGSNGAGQAILDARVLADELACAEDPFVALHRYDAIRRPQTTRVVEANRSHPPDAILREVFERTGDQPFDDVSAVISADELAGLSQRYRLDAGFDPTQLQD